MLSIFLDIIGIVATEPDTAQFILKEFISLLITANRNGFAEKEYYQKSSRNKLEIAFV